MIADKVLAHLTLNDFKGDMAMFAEVVSSCEILEQVKIEEFTKTQSDFSDAESYEEYKQQCGKVLGLGIMKVILKEIGGLQFHLSKTAIQIAAERYIIMHRKLGAKQLALDTGLTDRQVFKVLSENKLDSKTEPLF